ncbi:xanthine dehydrogenase family protein subunit M [Burkholderia sp. BCC0419]|uniref:FAD binding domain-containing protein n=1 Tax=Burkholderia sp. BCC0419 TaxID=486878 RepID=UPI00158C71FC|nr:xanthine dehydrogenase family protein subunit M [Burkholderia sp. BCC0419]
MKPAAFAYHRPRSLDEALALLAEHGDDAKIIAGGQSLVPMMNMRFAQPAHLIDVNALGELRGIQVSGGTLRIGALARHHDVAASETVRANCPLLAEAAATIGHYAIRQRGTLGGSLVNADPAAQLPLIAVTLDAVVEIAGPLGVREIPAREFIVAVMTTDLAPDEIVTALRFPVQMHQEGGGYGHGFNLFTRRHGDFAIVACAAALTLKGDVVQHLTVGAGGVGDTPLALADLSASFVGRRADVALSSEFARAAAAAVEPDDTPEISARFRRELVATLAQRSLTQALERAGTFA